MPDSTERMRKVRALNRIRKQAKLRGVSFTKMVKRELPGWPNWGGPRLTATRAEAIADKLEASDV